MVREHMHATNTTCDVGRNINIIVPHDRQRLAYSRIFLTPMAMVIRLSEVQHLLSWGTAVHVVVCVAHVAVSRSFLCV